MNDVALRAGAKKTAVVKGASHVVMISHPEAVARLIDEAATAITNLIRFLVSIGDPVSGCGCVEGEHYEMRTIGGRSILR